MEVELLKLAAGNGGPVIIFLICLVLFLRYIQGMHEDQKATIKEITDDHNANTKVLVDKVFDIAEKTTNALNEVKIAIVDLRNQIK